MSKKKRFSIFGLPVDNLSLDETIIDIDKMIQSGKPHQHVVVNMNKMMEVRKNKEFIKIIEGCDIINADGTSILWLAKTLGLPLKERISGIDLMEDLIELADKKQYKVFFLGAKEEVVKRVVQIYKEKFPNFNIAGFRNGYWSADEERDLIEEVRKVKPDILFLGMSSPKKEYFLHKYLNEMGVPFVMGVGGSFDVVAGFARRAPLWMQRCGLEWFFRFIQEPRRLWKRYLMGNLMFLRLLFAAIVKRVMA